MGLTAKWASDLHMLFFPYMAQGHMLPMIDMAKVFSSHGATVTILTTPANSLIIGPVIDRFNSSSSSSSSPVSIHVIPFPSAAAGLPPGCENRSFLPSESLRPNFYRAISLLRLPFDQVLRSLRPDAVVTDMFMPWTYQVATDHGIPRLVFDGTGFFSRCAEEAFSRLRPLDSLPPESRSEAFIHPGLPHRIEMLPSQFLEFSSETPMAAFDEINRLRKEVDPKSYGTIVNSFYELEPDYVDHYRKVIGRKAWHVGPLALQREQSR
ncbi:hypothetical protein HPP92_000314 [Vanilla planifolia]|uniref:Glycosyltransferase N-terminal domain-containing protein n=1 Tax=Vanilla planifolia TaxID=51239 RepID=A0A835VIL4_VANPL|nr:hypothetical protein HPP92_000289 [Vanilla planifolia]KAG0500242.1 hypothetical protein HPP92_000314 [Vanilla planifolia]